jgi:peptidyl-prolyl cis-trans isomerase D
MTMLDLMRRHKSWLKFSLGAVVVTFVLLYVPSFLKDPGASNDVIATVNDRSVMAGEFRVAYQQQLINLRAQFGGNLTDDMLKQFGVKDRLLKQMIDQECVLAEADRLGLGVTDGELRERILRMPGFQQNGQFIGDAAYQQILAMQRPALRPSEFEEQVRKTLLAEKLQAAVSGWVRVSDTEVEQEYRKKNEKVKLELALFTTNNFRAGIQPSDAELAAQFNAHTDTYKMPEKRGVRFLSIDAQSLKAKMPVTGAEVEARYQQNLSTYSLPEQIRASHVLIKSDGKDPVKDAAAKKIAEDVLAKAKAGADFAALAKQYSEDDSKTKGGDLDYFGRGRMVKEFEDAAFALKPGEISGVVKSQFGYHVIKLTDHKAPSTRPLADVRPQVEDQIRLEKAQAEVTKITDEIAASIKKPADLDTVARARGLAVGDSGLFSREEPLAGLGFAPTVSAEAFTLAVGQVSGAIHTDSGTVFIALTQIKPPYVPKLDEVKDKVREDVIKSKALDLAKAKAVALSQTTGKGNFAAAAKAAGVEIKTTDAIARDTAYPEVGVNGALDDAVFALPANAVSQPITTDTAIVVAHVIEKQDATAAGLATERDTLREQMLQDRRQQFFAAYMAKAQKTLTIRMHEEVVKTLMGES